MEIISINENFELDITPQALMVPEFKALFDADKTKAKKKAVGAMSYILLVYGNDSPYEMYGIEDRKKRVIEDLGLGSKWKVDKKVQAAIDRFQELTVTPSSRTLASIKNALMTSSEAIEMNTQLLKRNMTNVQARLTDDFVDLDLDSYQRMSAEVDNSMKMIRHIMELSKKIPGTIDTIKELERKVKEEQASASRVHGGGDVGIFEE